MIEVQATGEHGILDVRMTAPVTEADYRNILMPALDTAIAEGDRLRLLAILEAGVGDFTFGALGGIDARHFRAEDIAEAQSWLQS
ncbi:STAS/SEC14 domain-containing protein [Phaeobacter sp. HF9A]|uniref:STAS/SEC14 domain-containing protein n=1 Tax=Phaeobacter sp. HF9A TaxID=2721561 RepID=UPI0014302422|nr:STAS/SEC14 domain-containing protein [Phaeobacter sp. HF9A]NIZ14278.1 STAS/SEC14 domain-containing protein [Phaeobacter sp. HF9A]